MAAANKETIYVDVDDEITTIIEKVKASPSKIVALVLPKRATVLQSVVNMKLLKKAATSSKKNIVLITSEQGLLPLAGVAGLHVAKSLQSKPVIPPVPIHPGEEEGEPDVIDESSPVLDRSAPIGVLAAAHANDSDDTETIELDNMNIEAASPAAALKSKTKKMKHLKVPNFERFRLGLVLAVVGVLLVIVGWYVANVVLPRAKVVIQTNTTSAVSSFDFTASTAQAGLDVDAKKIPAVLKESKKSDSKKVAATGQRDDGTKAEGEITIKLTNCSASSVTVPAGTTVSSGGVNFVTQQAATMQSVQVGGNCRNDDFPNISSKKVDVIAAQNGDSYNLASGKTFTVSGFSAVSASNGSAFSGGTSKIVKIVSQKDIDDAVASLETGQSDAVKDELKAQFDAENLFALTETRKASDPKITATPAVNTEAEEVSVAVDTTFTMLGIKRDDLSQVVKKDMEGDEALQGQAITNDGIGEAIMRINNQPSNGEAFLSFRTSVTAGPEIDENAIREAIRGKKRGEAEAYIKKQPGVNDATITYSPFWVYSTPKAAKKITVIVEKSGDQAEDESNSNND